MSIWLVSLSNGYHQVFLVGHSHICNCWEYDWFHYQLIIFRCSLSDTPVFLPVKSPTVPFRLVVFELAQDIQVTIMIMRIMMTITIRMRMKVKMAHQVCVLCGPQPSLAELERLIVKSWKPALPHLAALQVAVVGFNIRWKWNNLRGVFQSFFNLRWKWNYLRSVSVIFPTGDAATLLPPISPAGQVTENPFLSQQYTLKIEGTYDILFKIWANFYVCVNILCK